MDEKVTFKPVYSTYDQGAVALIKSLLESHKINYYVDNENLAALGYGRATGLMTFMVATAQVDVAKELLKDIKE